MKYETYKTLTEEQRKEHDYNEKQFMENYIISLINAGTSGVLMLLALFILNVFNKRFDIKMLSMLFGIYLLILAIILLYISIKEISFQYRFRKTNNLPPFKHD